MTSRTRHHPSARRIVTAATFLLCLAVPATSYAQASRTWVSGTGDDVNPCSRTAPCKTFAGAISKTAAGGEIDALDPAGYGAVTITKAITIDGGGGQVASVLVSGTNAIVIQAPSNASVVLRNLRIIGIGTGINGIRILSGRTVHLDNDFISGFTTNGVDFATTSTDERVTLNNVTIQDVGGSGVLTAPQTGGGSGRVLVTNSSITDSGCGLSIGGACGAASSNGQPALAFLENTTLADNGFGAGTGNATGAGVFSVGSTNFAVIGNDTITGNTNGLKSAASGSIISFGDNFVYGNLTDGSPTTSTGPKRAVDLGRLWRTANNRSKKLHQAKARANKHRRRHRS